jgi:hypothetical protein
MENFDGKKSLGRHNRRLKGVINVDFILALNWIHLTQDRIGLKESVLKKPAAICQNDKLN